MKYLVLIFAFMVLQLSAKTLINGLSFSVNGEPVTLYELYMTKESYSISTDDAIEHLIEEKLIQSAYEKFGISSSTFEAEDRAREIAKNNQMTLYEFKEALKSRGIDWSSYIDELNGEIKKQNLHKKIAQSEIKFANRSDMLDYYNANIDKFKVAKSYLVLKYYSRDIKKLEEISLSPLRVFEGVQSERERIERDGISQNLLSILDGTEEGGFSQIIPIGDGYVMFLIEEKIGEEALEFEDVKNSIYSTIMQDREEKLVFDYFQRARASAKVEIIRLD